MLTAEENALQAQIGPGTPAGTLLRRYWQPLCVAAELTEQTPTRRATFHRSSDGSTVPQHLF